MEKEAQAEYAELLRRLYEAISSLTPTQAGKSIHATLRRLRRYFIRRKWTSGL